MSKDVKDTEAQEELKDKVNAGENKFWKKSCLLWTISKEL